MDELRDYSVIKKDSKECRNTIDQEKSGRNCWPQHK